MSVNSFVRRTYVRYFPFLNILWTCPLANLSVSAISPLLLLPLQPPLLLFAFCLWFSLALLCHCLCFAFPWLDVAQSLVIVHCWVALIRANFYLCAHTHTHTHRHSLPLIVELSIWTPGAERDGARERESKMGPSSRKQQSMLQVLQLSLRHSLSLSPA